MGVAYGSAALAVGHSLGGAAVTLAQERAGNARAVVVIAPAADMRAQAERFMRSYTARRASRASGSSVGMNVLLGSTYVILEVPPISPALGLTLFDRARSR